MKPVRGDKPRIFMVAVDNETDSTSYIDRTGSRNRMFSFSRIDRSLDVREQMERSRDLGCRIFLDSGAYTFQARVRTATGKVSDYAKLAREDVARDAFHARYVDYCLQEGWKFDCYANFDYKPHSATVMDVQNELEALGLYPLPSIHGDAGLEWMEQYIDHGHRYLAIGKGPRWGSRIKVLPYLDRVFNLAEKRDVVLHGYAMTDIELMLRFPWYSVDSAAWLTGRNTGTVWIPHNGRAERVHVADNFKRDLTWVARIMERHGFDLEHMRPKYSSINDANGKPAAYVERGVWNMYVLEHLKELGIRASGGASRKWGSLL